MTVIARHRTQKLHPIQFAPGCMSHNTMSHRAGNRIIHHIQAGITVNNNLICRDLAHSSQKLLGLLDSIQHTIITAVYTLTAFQIHTAIKNIQHTHGQIQLFGTGFSSGHIQLQPLILIMFILGLKFIFQYKQFVFTHGFIRLHNTLPILSHFKNIIH